MSSILLHYVYRLTISDDESDKAEQQSSECNNDDPQDNNEDVHPQSPDSAIINNFFQFDDDAETITYSSDDTCPYDSPLYQNQEGDPVVQAIMWDELMKE